MKNKKITSLSFVFMLVISTVAFAFLIGSEMEMVSGDEVYAERSESHFQGLVGYEPSSRMDTDVNPTYKQNQNAFLSEPATEDANLHLNYPGIYGSSACLTPSTQILTPYLSDGTYLSDEKLEELNNQIKMGGAN